MVPTTTNALHFPLLSIILFLPGVVGVLLALFIEGVRPVRLIAAVTVVIDFLLAMFLIVRFATGSAGSGWVFQFADKHDWIPSLGITYWVGVDGPALFLVGLTTLIMAIAVFAGNFMIDDRVRSFTVFMLVLETGILGVFMALNVFLFYVFWEAMLIPVYFLLGMWSEERGWAPTMKFIVYTILGSFLMLVAIFYLNVTAGTLDMPGPSGLIAHPLSAGVQTWLFLGFALAFAIKLPLFPFHTWAPDAYGSAPVPVVIALAGILSKAGAFGFLRYCLPLFPSAAHSFGGLLSVLAIIGLLYAALLALVQTDIKRLVAYSSISHMNLILLGIFALNATGMDGAVLQMVNHSVIISALFLTVAYIVARTGTRSLREMGGLGERWPVLMWLFFIFVLAGLDLPGLSSFAGEFLILAGLFKANVWFSGVAALVVILAAWYMIRFFQRTMNGPPAASPGQVAVVAEQPDRTVYQFPVARRLLGNDLLPREIALLVPLILLVLYLGVQPDPFTTRLNPTTTQVSTLVHNRGPGAVPVRGGGGH